MIFLNGSKIIINKQSPLQQLWITTKFNGDHFNFQNDQWIDVRTSVEFWSFLENAVSKQAEQTIMLKK
ncbi:MAG: CyaY protein [Paraglaciecola sp.]|jgi:CyaY protein